MAKVNSLGSATQGVQYFDGISLYSGVTGTTGQILQANTGSAPTFVNLSSLGVSSITGTANQVLANGTSGSATVGAITLTLPQSIATTSNVQFGSLGLGVAASGTTGRIQTTGISKFGSSSSFTSVAAHEFVWVSAVGSFINTYLTGTMTNVSAGGLMCAIEIQPTFNGSSGSWLAADGAFFNPTYTLAANLLDAAIFRSVPDLSGSSGFTLTNLYGFRASLGSTAGFVGTVTNYYGVYVEALNVGTNRYGARFLNPAAGTISIACYADNLSAGYNVTPPSNGMIVSGAVGIGTNAPVSKLDVSGGMSIGSYAGVNAAPSNGMVISGQSIFKSTSSFVGGSVEIGGSDRISFALGGTKTTTDSSAQYGMFLNPTFIPASSTTQVAQVVSYAQFSPASTIVITTAYNFYLQSGGQGGAGSVTTGYNLYVDNAAFGTTAYAASIQGGVVYKYSGLNASSGITTANRIVGITSTASARTMTLPSTVPAAGWRVTFKDESGGAATNNITIDGNGHNIDGSATITINANYGSLDVYSNGTQYYAV